MWKDNNICPYCEPPRYVVFTHPESGHEYGFETAAMCDLVDKHCLVEHGEPTDCDIYMEYLADVEEEHDEDYS